MTYFESTQKTEVNFSFIKDVVQWMQIEMEMEKETLALLACTSEFDLVGHFVKTEKMVLVVCNTYITHLYYLSIFTGLSVNCTASLASVWELGWYKCRPLTDTVTQTLSIDPKEGSNF